MTTSTAQPKPRIVGKLPKSVSAFGYEDYRATGDNTAVPFYVGIGNANRVRDFSRDNPQHARTVKKSGLVRRVVMMSDDYDALTKWEIDRIAELRAAGVNLANITSGGQGTRGVVVLRNTLTSETFSHEAEKPYPPHCVNITAGFVALRHAVTSCCRARGVAQCENRRNDWPRRERADT